MESQFQEVLDQKARDRINRLHALYQRGPVFSEYVGYTRQRRARLFYLRAYVNDKKAYSTRLRRAYAEAAILNEMEPIINEDELIVGVPDYGRLTEDEQRELTELECAAKGMFDTGPLTIGHMAIDYPKLLRVGVDGLLDEIRCRKNALSMNRPEDYPKAEFYECCEIELEALKNLQGRYAKRAWELSAEATGKRKAELEEIARIFENVPAKPAKTFYEALECVHFYNAYLWELYNFGRADQFLQPYYEADIQAGRITREKAVELYACFLLMPEAYIQPNVVIDALLGGRDPQGRPVENDVTFIALDAAHYARSPQGKAALAVSEDTSDALLRRAIRLNAEGLTQPALFNDRVITQGNMRIGMPPEDARNYCHTGCVEITCIGKSGVYPVAPYHNTLSMLLDALREEPYAVSLGEVFERLEKRVAKAVFDRNVEINRRQMERSRNGCEPMRACVLVHDCLERGMIIDEGGAVYNHIQPNFLGVANTVDSLAVVDRLVFQEERLTLPKLLEILNGDFAGEEPLRQFILQKIPHYGMDDDITNGLAQRVTEMIKRCCAGVVTFRGSFLVPGAFSYVEHATHGRLTPASPDGRKAWTPLASGSGPTQGREMNGPTASLLSMTSWDNSPFIGGLAINMNFSPGQMSGEFEDKMLAFVRAFMEKGGFELQLNCVGKQTLLDAQAHPENHRDLLVRVGGFSAYFCMLPPDLQNEIIERNEHSFQ